MVTRFKQSAMDICPSMLSYNTKTNISYIFMKRLKLIWRNLKVLCEPCTIRRWAIRNGTRTRDPHKPDSFRIQFAAYSSDRPASRPFQCQPWWQSLPVICSALRPSLSLFWCCVDLAINRQTHTHAHTLKAVVDSGLYLYDRWATTAASNHIE